VEGYWAQVKDTIYICICVPRMYVCENVRIPKYRYGYYRRQIPRGLRAHHAVEHACGTRYRCIYMYIYICVCVCVSKYVYIYVERE